MVNLFDSNEPKKSEIYKPVEPGVAIANQMVDVFDSTGPVTSKPVKTDVFGNLMTSAETFSTLQNGSQPIVEKPNIPVNPPVTKSMKEQKKESEKVTEKSPIVPNTPLKEPEHRPATIPTVKPVALPTIPINPTTTIAPAAAASQETSRKLSVKTVQNVSKPQPNNDPLPSPQKKVQFEQPASLPQPTITSVTNKTVAQEKDFDWDLDDGGSGMRKSFQDDPAGKILILNRINSRICEFDFNIS